MKTKAAAVAKRRWSSVSSEQLRFCRRMVSIRSDAVWRADQRIRAPPALAPPGAFRRTRSRGCGPPIRRAIVLYAWRAAAVRERRWFQRLGDSSASAAGGLVRSARCGVRIRGSALPRRSPRLKYIYNNHPLIFSSLPPGAIRRTRRAVLRSAARIGLREKRSCAGAKRRWSSVSSEQLRFCRRMVSIRSERECGVRIRGSALPSAHSPALGSADPLIRTAALPSACAAVPESAFGFVSA